VLQVDLLGRCAPKAAQLASMAWRGGEAFFPDAVGSLSELVSASGGDPLVRELVSGGIAAAEATLKALEPDVVVATHPAAGGIAAEVAERCGCEVFVVLPDLMPDRFWLHPGVALWFVAGTDARDELARRRVDWSRIAVSGVPQESPRSRQDARAALVPRGSEDRFTVLLAGIPGPESAAESLRALGLQVILEADGTRASAGAPGRGAAVVRPPAEAPRADLLAAADVVLATRCGSLAWEATATGTPLVVVGESGRMEQASIDLLVDAGAALQARDIQDAVRRVAYLAGHAGRLSALATASAGLGRPHAAKAVAERVLAAFD
jgi:UDP-N-acetylglucosamine:LPS N-acetylglucosamine transferase